MPSRNVLKQDEPQSYFHVYARGVGKMPIFLDESDYGYFIYLLGRYLSPKSSTNRFGYVYPTYYKQLELASYCLMNNHFHLLIYQEEEGSMTGFMRSLMTSYSRYFNLKHNRTGPLFESRYKASTISNHGYLQHISRYIHLNPRYWRKYPYSSLKYFIDIEAPNWLQTQKVIDLFTDKTTYLTFMADYVDHKDMLDQIKHELADS